MNQSIMTYKNKRLEKILKKNGLKGWLKPVDSLENSQFVLVENKRCAYNSFLIKIKDYKILLERGETYPPDIVHFLVNPFPNKPWFSRVCSKSLLKTLGKEEIARNEQFLLFPQCFLPILRT